MSMKHWIPALGAALLLLGVTAATAAASDRASVEILGQSGLGPTGELDVRGAAPAAAPMTSIDVAVITHPPEVLSPGSLVRHIVGFYLTPHDAPVTVTSIESTLYGDVADPANPLIESTRCSLPAQPPDDWSAFTWACDFFVHVSGAPGDAVTDTVSVTIEDTAGVEVVQSAQYTVTIIANPGAITGVVVDAGTGEPIGDAWIFASQGGDTYSGADGRFFLNSGPGDHILITGAGTALQLPDEFGEWPYPLEQYDNSYPLPGLDLNEPSEPPIIITVAAGATVDIGEWRLSKGAAVEGRVTDSQGHPLSGYLVTAAGAPGAAGSETDAGGRYRVIPLHGATHTIQVWEPGRVVAERVLRVEFGETVSAFDFMIETGDEPPVTTTTATTEAPTTDRLPPTGFNGYAAALGLGLLATGIAVVAGVAVVDRRRPTNYEVYPVSRLATVERLGASTHINRRDLAAAGETTTNPPVPSAPTAGYGRSRAEVEAHRDEAELCLSNDESLLGRRNITPG